MEYVVQDLLQSEIVQDGSNKVGFFGKCQRHADYCTTELDDEMKEGLNSGSREVCARTEVSWMSLRWNVILNLPLSE